MTLFYKNLTDEDRAIKALTSSDIYYGISVSY